MGAIIARKVERNILRKMLVVVRVGQGLEPLPGQVICQRVEHSQDLGVSIQMDWLRADLLPNVAVGSAIPQPFVECWLTLALFALCPLFCFGGITGLEI